MMIQKLSNTIEWVEQPSCCQTSYKVAPIIEYLEMVKKTSKYRKDQLHIYINFKFRSILSNIDVLPSEPWLKYHHKINVCLTFTFTFTKQLSRFQVGNKSKNKNDAATLLWLIYYNKYIFLIYLHCLSLIYGLWMVILTSRKAESFIGNNFS